jgi:hypothetical protein
MHRRPAGHQPDPIFERDRIIIVASPGGFDQFVAAAGEPAPDLCLPVPVPPDPARLTRLAAAHGIQILPLPEP